MRAIIGSLFFVSNVVLASFPENNLDRQDFVQGFMSPMTELQFRRTIDEVTNFYRPIIKSLGGTLRVDYNWTDSTVNAYADKQGNDWSIAMFGGMARRQEVTRDGFQLVVCHELGHLLGGFPFYTNEDLAAEGQADYWATQACAKRVWKGNGTAAKTRALAASQSLGNLLATLEGSQYPSPTRKDLSRVIYTQDTHPKAQCRLDTYLAGVGCNQVFPLTAYPKNQFEAYSVSCMPPQNASRPRCWFAPGN